MKDVEQGTGTRRRRHRETRRRGLPKQRADSTRENPETGTEAPKTRRTRTGANRTTRPRGPRQRHFVPPPVAFCAPRAAFRSGDWRLVPRGVPAFPASGSLFRANSVAVPRQCPFCDSLLAMRHAKPRFLPVERPRRVKRRERLPGALCVWRGASAAGVGLLAVRVSRFAVHRDFAPETATPSGEAAVTPVERGVVPGGTAVVPRGRGPIRASGGTCPVKGPVDSEGRKCKRQATRGVSRETRSCPRRRRFVPRQSHSVPRGRRSGPVTGVSCPAGWLRSPRVAACSRRIRSPSPASVLSATVCYPCDTQKPRFLPGERPMRQITPQGESAGTPTYVRTYARATRGPGRVPIRGDLRESHRGPHDPVVYDRRAALSIGAGPSHLLITWIRSGAGSDPLRGRSTGIFFHLRGSYTAPTIGAAGLSEPGFAPDWCSWSAPEARKTTIRASGRQGRPTRVRNGLCSRGTD